MSRTYRDPIHKEIKLNSEDAVENLLINLIDSKELQRLRWIRQLGTGWFTFHGAEASRFGHSLGSMHIARAMLEKITANLNLEPSTAEEYKTLVLCAALLHDVGHGPFSHSSEPINNIKHEVWTREIILDASTEVNQCLEKHQPGLAEKIVSVLSKSYPVKFICEIVNSQIDCDRFDYLIRDSYFTGTEYGKFDLNRVISSIAANPIHDCLVISGEKGMLAVEDYLYARYSMYLQVYQHKKCLASDSLLLKLFKRVKMLVRNKRIAFIEDAVYDWIHQPEKMTVENYLKIDDTSIMHHIKHWTEEKDLVLKDLARRFLERKIFKAEKVEKAVNQEELLGRKAAELKLVNIDPDYYLDLVSIASKPYSFYNPNQGQAILVEDSNNELKEISTLSHVVDSLVKNDFENSWLINVEVDRSELYAKN